MKRQSIWTSFLLMIIMLLLLAATNTANASIWKRGNDSTLVIISFEDHHDTFLGKKLKKDGMIMYAGNRIGESTGGELGYVFENETFQGVFTLDGAERFVIKSKDEGFFGLTHLNVVDRYFMANEIFFEAYLNGELVGTQKVEIGHDLSEHVELDPIFHKVTEIRVGSLQEYGVWNYFDQFKIIQYASYEL